MITSLSIRIFRIRAIESSYKVHCQTADKCSVPSYTQHADMASSFIARNLQVNFKNVKEKTYFCITTTSIFHGCRNKTVGAKGDSEYDYEGIVFTNYLFNIQPNTVHRFIYPPFPTLVNICQAFLYFY